MDATQQIQLFREFLENNYKAELLEKIRKTHRSMARRINPRVIPEVLPRDLFFLFQKLIQQNCLGYMEKF